MPILSGTKTNVSRGVRQAPLERPRRSFHVRKIASNFAILGLAEVICRTSSFLLTVSLTRRLDDTGFGRIEFSFNVVFWLVLIVRDCFETIVTREIARHPRLTRSLVNHILAVKLILALGILAVLSGMSVLLFVEALDRWVMIVYGLLLLTTALGLDFVFRGKEAMGLVAVSLLVRTAVYCSGSGSGSTTRRGSCWFRSGWPPES